MAAVRVTAGAPARQWEADKWAQLPACSPAPNVGESEIMYAEFTGAVGCCCRAGGHLYSKMIAAQR